VLSTRVDFCRSTIVAIGGVHVCRYLATCIVVPDDPVDNLCHGHMLGLGFGLDFLNEGFFNVQRPAFCWSKGLIRGAEEMFPFAPPREDFLKISEIGERYINVDICGSTFVNFSGAPVVGPNLAKGQILANSNPVRPHRRCSPVWS
jgi:hypothetical protein